MSKLKPNGKKRRRAANRRGGSGRGISKAAAEHADETLNRDLRMSAERTAEQMVSLPAKVPEVLPGIASRSFLPALGRQGLGDEVTTTLLTAARDRSEIDVQRKDRPGKTRPYQPAGALEFAHGQLRLDLLLAIRWGLQMGLPTPNDLLDQLLIKLPDYLKQVFGEGLDALAVCLHAPNPYLEEILHSRGWRGAIQDPGASDKIGAWNLHVQVYVCRVRDRVIQTAKQLFTHASDVVVSSYQLRQLGVDLDLHRASRFRGLREPKYARWIATGGKDGRPLPDSVRRQYEAGLMMPEAAIAAAVDVDLARKNASWTKAKQFHSLIKMNETQVKAAREAQAIDLLLSEWITTKMEVGLPLVHPGYADLIRKAREVFPELKRRQMASGHRLSFNEVLTMWERAKEERARLDQAAHEQSEHERAVAAAKKVHERLQEEVREKAQKDRLDAAAREERERVEKVVRDKEARHRLVEAVHAARQEGETKVQTIYGVAKNIHAQATMLYELMRIAQASARFNAKQSGCEFSQWWVDQGLVIAGPVGALLGGAFADNLARVAAVFPYEGAQLKAQAEMIGYSLDPVVPRESAKESPRNLVVEPPPEKFTGATSPATDGFAPIPGDCPIPLNLASVPARMLTRESLPVPR